MGRFLFHSSLILGLTLLTQVGGLAWLLAMTVKRRVLAFLTLYVLLTVVASFTAPLFGRQALSCWQTGPLQMQSWTYCVLNRNYASPEVIHALNAAATSLDSQFKGTKTLVLDLNFPFLDGFPLLPHLSHDDGEKADLAFFYRDENGYLPGVTRSPLGYFAFEYGSETCPPRWPSLRWDLRFLQPIWRDLQVEPKRTAALVRHLSDNPSIGKIFLEPHLKSHLNLTSDKIRFQGCRAARHDDHIHLQLN
ncbi:hypothetical protein [Shimia sediminis]|uniref:hypothetical protein n=1 Tax=Shimia sediminis TaxID=2497945 RepID=UPI000F8C8EDE|nr:hypothetical protein [Shimia sediminis]